jgi:hypothetical protein
MFCFSSPRIAHYLLLLIALGGLLFSPPFAASEDPPVSPEARSIVQRGGIEVGGMLKMFVLLCNPYKREDLLGWHCGKSLATSLAIGVPVLLFCSIAISTAIGRMDCAHCVLNAPSLQLKLGQEKPYVFVSSRSSSSETN